ncbi:MAG: FAD-dependent oxidoreductase [Pseudomonadota bacterium]
MSQLHKTKHAVIVGAGIAGLMSAIALHRQGIRVTLVERDPPTDPSLQPENAWDWKRTGVPQSVHPHFFMGRLRMHLQEFYPDLLDKLFEAGAGQSTLADYVHPKFRHRLQPSEQDARLRTLNCQPPVQKQVVGS